MNLKVLCMAFLLLVSLSAICNVAITALKTPMLCSQGKPIDVGYHTLGGDGNEPGDGDERIPPVWP